MGGLNIWFLSGFPNSIHIHEFIHTIRSLLSLLEKLKYLGTLGSVTEHSASAMEEIYSPKILCSFFDTGEDVQFASENHKIHSPEGTDWAGDGMSLEPHWVKYGPARNQSLTPLLRGMIESSTGPGELNDTQPNTELQLVPQTQALTLTGAQPVKYQVKHACCATGHLCWFRWGLRVGWCRR